MSDKIYLVSLKNDDIRRKTLKERFKRYDEFIILEAVDGRQMSLKDYYSTLTNSYKAHRRILSPGEIGCARSHLNIYDDFLNTKDEICLVLEDDIAGDDKSIQKAFEIYDKLPSNSLLLCERQFCNSLRDSILVKKIDDNLYKVSNLSKRFVTGTCAYMIDKNIAKVLKNSQDKALNLADRWDEFGNFDIYISDIFTHPNYRNDSSIEKERNLKKIEYKPNIKDYINTFFYIFKSRIEVYIFGYKKIAECMK